jgi:hypothetical protein
MDETETKQDETIKKRRGRPRLFTEKEKKERAIQKAKEYYCRNWRIIREKNRQKRMNEIKDPK